MKNIDFNNSVMPFTKYGGAHWITISFIKN
jgi:hypothetical protein